MLDKWRGTTVLSRIARSHRVTAAHTHLQLRPTTLIRICRLTCLEPCRTRPYMSPCIIALAMTALFLIGRLRPQLLSLERRGTESRHCELTPQVPRSSDFQNSQTIERANLSDHLILPRHAISKHFFCLILSPRSGRSTASRELINTAVGIAQELGLYD